MRFNNDSLKPFSMDILKELRRDVGQESVAYGYTLSIWGSGALLLTGYTVTPAVILAYVTGAVIGFGALAAAVFGSFLEETEQGTPEFIVASMVHLLASLGSVALSYLLIKLLSPVLAASMVAFVVGFHATATYNLLLLAEEALSEEIQSFERV